MLTYVRLRCSLPKFFFSSRRRHTRWTGDWSSDVCSSDLCSDTSPSACAISTGRLGSTTRGWRRSAGFDSGPRTEIERASCRERAEMAEVAGTVKKKRSLPKQHLLLAERRPCGRSKIAREE